MCQFPYNKFKVFNKTKLINPWNRMPQYNDAFGTDDWQVVVAMVANQVNNAFKNVFLSTNLKPKQISIQPSFFNVKLVQ